MIYTEIRNFVEIFLVLYFTLKRPLDHLDDNFIIDHLRLGIIMTKNYIIRRLSNKIT